MMRGNRPRAPAATASRPAMLSGLWALFRALAAMAEADRDRWALWLPVVFGGGIALYFALPFEPARLPAILAMSAALGLALAAQRAGWALLSAVALLPAALFAGIAIAGWQTDRAAAPVLDRPAVLSGLSGRVTAVERFPDGPRVRLEALDARWGWRDAPRAVRVKLRTGDAPALGSRISLTAKLSPPPRPAYPGAYDFARVAWFERLGGVGFALSDWHAVPARTEPGPMARAGIALDALRQHVGLAVREALPGTAGAVAAALLTGDRSAAPEAVLEDLRRSGLAHLLAISGLHIGMVAMTVFVAVRFLLALHEPFARDKPIKKWAAAAAMLAAFLYLLLAGATVPTQRAFMMTGIVLLAVLTDRQAISMRLVAVAATVVLLIAPDALVGASFQLSFAAVVALVAVYESFRPGGSWLGEERGLLRRAGFYLAAVCLTTVIAGAATAPFAIHHFGRVAQYSVLANLFAVPIVTFLVMPAGLLSLLLMPFGLHGIALAPMGWGIDAVLWIAASVAALPGAVGQVPPLTGWGLIAVVLGGLWTAIWRRPWRWAGAPLVAAGLLSPLAQPVPLAVLHGDGDQAALVWDGALWVESLRRDRFAQSIWEEKTALPVAGDWADLAATDGAPIRCDPLGCLVRWPAGAVLALTRDPRAVPEDCRRSGAARLPIQPHPALCRRAQAIGPADLARDGVHVLYPAVDGAIRLETVQSSRGDRPWVR